MAVAKNSKCKAAVTTPFGVFIFHVMPFGLNNAGSTFQHMIDKVLAGLPSCYTYMDDILIFSRSVEEHEEAVQAVLELLRKAGHHI